MAAKAMEARVKFAAKRIVFIKDIERDVPALSYRRQIEKPAHARGRGMQARGFCAILTTKEAFLWDRAPILQEFAFGSERLV